MSTAHHPAWILRTPASAVSAYRAARAERGAPDHAASDSRATAAPDDAAASGHGGTHRPRARRGRNGDAERRRTAGAPRQQGSSAEQRRARGARDARRDIEAGLTGAPIGSPGSPDPWTACWEEGLRPGIPAAQLFDRLAAYHGGVFLLHDLAVAGTARIIDHVLVGPGGVVVVATESCRGRVRSDGVRLRVAGRDRSAVVDLALWQTEVVRATLAGQGLGGGAVLGVVHWTDVEALGRRDLSLRGVPLLSAGAAVCMAAAGTAMSPLDVERATAALCGRRP